MERNPEEKLRQAIASACNDFSEDTGMAISEIKMEFDATTNTSGIMEYAYYDVKITARNWKT